MVHCRCGKAIEKVPDWLAGVQVEFVCNNCPNRKIKNIAFTSLEPSMPHLVAESVPEEPDLEEGEEGADA
jgi:hypothetical protein